MSGLLWSKWYYSDWTNDPGLRACSIAARGLWMDMLCIAARHDPPGYVAVNGNGLTSDTLARMVGASVHEIEPLMAELERNGVFSRNRTGTIYSRRMVRETKAMKLAKENGKKGGNPNIRKTKENSGQVNPPVNATLNTYKPEARSQKPEDIIPSGSVSAKPREVEADRQEPPPPSAAIPNVNEITTAVVSALGEAGDPVALGIGVVAPVLGLLKAGFTLDGDIIPACQDRSRRPGRTKIRSYEIVAQISREYRERMTIADAPAVAARSPPKARNWPPETWRGYVRRWRDGAMTWPESFGPKPGQPGCEVPKEILDDELKNQVPA